MQYDRLALEVAAAGLTLRDFAQLLRLNPNSLYNCKRTGSVPNHVALAAQLMRIAAEAGVPFTQAIETLPLQGRAARGEPFAPGAAAPRQAVPRPDWDYVDRLVARAAELRLFADRMQADVARRGVTPQSRQAIEASAELLKSVSRSLVREGERAPRQPMPAQAVR